MITAAWWTWLLLVLCAWFSGAAFGYVRGIDISRKRIREKKEVRRHIAQCSGVFDAGQDRGRLKMMIKL